MLESRPLQSIADALEGAGLNLPDSSCLNLFERDDLSILLLLCKDRPRKQFIQQLKECLATVLPQFQLVPIVKDALTKDKDCGNAEVQLSHFLLGDHSVWDEISNTQARIGNHVDWGKFPMPLKLKDVAAWLRRYGWSPSWSRDFKLQAASETVPAFPASPQRWADANKLFDEALPRLCPFPDFPMLFRNNFFANNRSKLEGWLSQLSRGALGSWGMRPYFSGHAAVQLHYRSALELALHAHGHQALPLLLRAPAGIPSGLSAYFGDRSTYYLADAAFQLLYAGRGASATDLQLAHLCLLAALPAQRAGLALPLLPVEARALAEKDADKGPELQRRFEELLETLALDSLSDEARRCLRLIGQARPELALAVPLQPTQRIMLVLRPGEALIEAAPEKSDRQQVESTEPTSSSYGTKSSHRSEESWAGEEEGRSEDWSEEEQEEEEEEETLPDEGGIPLQKRFSRPPSDHRHVAPKHADARDRKEKSFAKLRPWRRGRQAALLNVARAVVEADAQLRPHQASIQSRITELTSEKVQMRPDVDWAAGEQLVTSLAISVGLVSFIGCSFVIIARQDDFDDDLVGTKGLLATSMILLLLAVLAMALEYGSVLNVIVGQGRKAKYLRPAFLGLTVMSGAIFVFLCWLLARENY